jgi:hypothetical protein
VSDTAVRVSWTGSLDAGESWVLYRGDLWRLRATGGNDAVVLHAGSETELTDPDAGSWYYKVRCEGGAAPGDWSNWGFRLERSFDVIGPPGSFRSFRGIYFLSLPLLPGLVDVGTGGPAAWPCDQAGNGTLTPDDILCESWSGRDSVANGRFSVQWLDPATRSWNARHGIKVGGNPPRVLGSTVDLERPDLRGSGQLIQVSGDVVENRGLIAGAHDPDFTGYVVSRRAGTTPVHVLSLPYHAVYRTADELLCGVEGWDWVDGNGDGAPDTCPNGVFDPLSGAQVYVFTFDNMPDGSPSDNSFIGRGVAFDELFLDLVFFGVRFDLIPGDAYAVVLGEGYQDRTFLPPTY